ncbi:MAG: glycosyltransferase [Candidatus Nomurabacteria bacterium]|nr:MAG: glycosyltransferase [Candidatus Nomurabacteria bacterium]
MKIVQVNKFAYPRGGAERHMLDLIKVLQAHGHEVSVFAMRHPENLLWPDSDLFVSQVNFEHPRSFSEKLRAAGRMLWSFEAARKFGELLDRRQPDLVHVHNIYHQISPSILREAKKRGIPVVMTLHDFKFIAPNYLLYADGKVSEATKPNKYWKLIPHREIKHSFAASLLCALEMYLHKTLRVYEKYVDVFIAPSQFMADKVREYGVQAKRVEVLANFMPQRDLPSSQEKGYALFFGRLAKEKGVDVLIDAWRELKDIPLKIAGTGPEELKLRQQAASVAGHQISFVGHQNGKALDKLIAGARLIVFPSRWYENQPMSLIEAFRFQKPVIASRLGAIPELVHKNDGGRLVPPNDSGSITEAVRELWNNAELQRMGEYNYQRSLLFSSEGYYEKYLSLFDEISDKSQSRTETAQ